YTTGNLILQFIERITDCEFGRDLGNRKASGFRRQSRRTRYARVHFDYQHAAVVGINRELHIGATGINADFAQARDRGVAHDLIFLVGQRLRRSHRDRITGMHAHRVKVLDRADDDAVIVLVAHHFHLEFFPADHRLLDQHFMGRTRFEATLDHRDEFFAVVGNPAAAAADRERWTNDGRKTDHRLYLQ